MGRILKTRSGLLVFGAAVALGFVLFTARGVVRWREMRTVDRMVAAHKTPAAVDFVTSHFQVNQPEGWRALRHLALAILHQGLHDPDPYERCYAATSLVSYGDWTGRPVIDSSMAAKDPFLQKAAIEGLAEARDATAVELLGKFYGAGNRHLRVWTTEALAENGDHQALPLLLSATTSSDDGVKLWAVWGLGHLHDPRVINYLRSIQTKETDPLITAAIAHALLILGDRSMGSVELIEATFYDPDPDRASNAALELGDAEDFTAVPQLRGALLNIDLDLSIRLAAAVALTHYGNRQGMTLLQTVAGDPYLNSKLAPLLLYLDFNLSRPLLISAMASQNLVLQLAATEAIGRMGGRNEIGVLTAALGRTSEAFMTAQIAWSLGRIARPESIAPLIPLLKSSNVTVRDSAADAVARTATWLLSGDHH
ncbi:MAG TPA: HEAT repeat domain-containing protein [Candidatus Binataceae bacterium]|nr:HEAT repeat domain-containing protein [Candidatus Binataceae bacterium]